MRTGSSQVVRIPKLENEPAEGAVSRLSNAQLAAGATPEPLASPPKTETPLAITAPAPAERPRGSHQSCHLDRFRR